MQLSTSGRVVLIDDTADEALPLMSAFGKNAIPYTYYDGRPDGLPDAPSEGIRFVFLDIELQGMEAQNEKTIASALVNRLRKIISTSNGPYAIIFWTKHNEIITQILENCSTASISPVAWVDLEKAQCRTTDGKYDISIISTKLKNKLEAIGAFRLYVEWENILHLASKRFIHDFSKLVPSGDNWSAGTSALFYKLYKAYVGKNEITDQTEQFKCSSLLMNNSFLDTLQEHSSEYLTLPGEYKLTGGDVDTATLAKLNTYLFLNSSSLPRPMTGYVYLEENENVKASIVKDVFKEDQVPNNISLCKVVVTPLCDIAQNKVLKFKINEIENKIHRIIYGLLLPSPNNSTKRSEAQFKIGPFWHEDKSWIIILHFSTLTFQHEGELNGEHLFYLRRDLIFDIQSKAANHVNRLGNLQM